MSKKPQKPVKKDAKPDQEMAILVCARADDTMEVLKGSIWDTCHECGISVWISLSGQRALKQNPKMQIICMGCLYQKRAEMDEKTEFQTAPGAMEEIRRYFAERKKH